jgi:exodeoxyribonuclease VII large subunit
VEQQQQLTLAFGRERRFLTVTEFTEMMRGMLEEVFPDIWIAGEISGAKTQPSGHIYFTLKDGDAVLSAVCYRSAARYLRFKPQDGVAVLARGRVDIWPPSGRYQLIVEALEPQGRGALQFAFEQLKAKLAKEGLFDEARKRPIPPLPRRIGIVTSPTGAVIQDMLRILERRFAGLHIRLFPAAVQGDGATDQICRGIEYFSDSKWADVVIVARGGGSLEDLWAFNEESVARAIAACNVPVISAVGHETDYTIADFVADLRAPTPSAAADLVIQSKSRLMERLAAVDQRLQQSIQYRVAVQSKRLHQLGMERATAALRRRIGRLQQRNDEAEYHLRQRIRAIAATRRRGLQQLHAQLIQLDVRLRFAAIRRRQEALHARLINGIERRLTTARRDLEAPVAHLTQLNPLKILERGFALVVREGDGAIVKSVDQAPIGTRVEIRVAAGTFHARSED